MNVAEWGAFLPALGPGGGTTVGTEIIYPQLLYYFEDSKEESKAAKAAGPVRSFKPPCYSRGLACPVQRK